MPLQQPGAIHAPTQHTSQHAAMLTFLARLSGRRRHVRRPAETTPATPTPSVELPEEAASRLRSDERLTCQQTEEEGRASEERIEELCALRLTGRCDSSATTSMHHRRYQRHGRGQTQSCPHGDTIQGQHRHHAYSQLRPSSCKLELPRCRIHPYLTTLLLLLCTLCGIADACSSRSTPRPRPPTPSPRPNITFHTYSCPPDYAEWYCLNGASCFTVKIVDSLLYNCLCPNGYIGQRCEFKDLDGSYLPSRQRVMLETASIAGGATIAVFLVVIICIAAYIHCKRKQKELRTSSNCVDTVDGPARDPERRPFTNRSRSLVIFMTKNSSSSLQPAVK